MCGRLVEYVRWHQRGNHNTVTHGNKKGITSKHEFGLADRAGFLIIGRIVALMCGFVGPILLTRFLTRSEYGTYRQLILISGLFIPIIALGFPQGMLYFFPRLSPPSRPRLIWQTTLMLTLLGVVGAVALSLSRGWFAGRFHNTQLSHLLPIFCIYVFAAVAGAHVYNSFVAQGAARTAALYTSMLALLSVLGAAVGAAKFSVVGATVGYTSAGVAVSSLGITVLLRRCIGSLRGKFRFDRTLVVEQLNYGIPLGVSTGVRTLGFYADQVIVSALRTPAIYAVYSIGMLQLRLTNAVTVAVATALTPVWALQFKEQQAAQALVLFRRAARKLGLLLFPMAVSLCLTAQDIVLLLFSSRYEASVPVFRVSLLVMFSHVFAPDALLRALGRTRVLILGSTGVLIVGSAFTIVGLKLLGLPGAALGSVTAVYTLKIYYGWEVKKSVGKEAGAMLPWAELIRVVAVALFAAMPAAILLWMLPSGLPRLALVALAYAASYIGLLMATHTLTPADRDLVRRWISSRFLAGILRR